MAGCSTVEELQPQHQMFINFRGVELRNGFVSHLVSALKRNNINVFIDNHEDRHEPIEILLKRIKESSIAMVIFSPKYTESSWCVRELAMIKDCMDEGTLKVIPIFYKVDPFTVRFLIGEFGDTFRVMAKGDERKKKWEQAFKAISSIMGTVLDEKSDELQVIEKTVNDVKKVLKIIPSKGYSTVEELQPQHQVFINFRGVELRNGFVSHLVSALKLNNINVFIDNYEDRHDPMEILLKRIKESSIAMVIFSPKYTESSWCVRELAMIKDCMDEGTLKVIPIFYKVDPSTVRYLIGEFGDTFRVMAKGDERKKKWEQAFKAISSIMGTVLDEKSDELQVIEKTVNDVKKVLKIIPSKGYSTVEELQPQHQVFINFRGVELRNGFVSHLVSALKLNNINVFIDNYEDRHDPMEILLKRIKESSIAMVIFSPKYTESSWCVRELAMIKDCMDEGTLKVIPIFYMVDPSTVKYLKGEFGDAFRNMAKGDERKKWKEAFKAITSIMGFFLDEKSNQHDKIQQSVQWVKKLLNKFQSEGSKKSSVDPSRNSDTRTSSRGLKDATFGISQRLKELKDKLDFTDKKTRIIGVVGMPGIGKSTLLKELFKWLKNMFLRGALIDQIREKSKSCEELDILPKLLVQKLLALNESDLDNVEDPYETYKDELLRHKVFVILDDVSKSEQIKALLGRLDWIQEGSRIVIATNDMSLLKDLVEDDPYVVQKLNHQDGLNLFSYHAFDQDNPPEDFMKLSEEFVHYAKGHPLALKILGGELRGKSNDIWVSQLMYLAHSLSPIFGTVFQASYDELSAWQKEVLLDISCFRSQGVDYVQRILASSEAMGEVEEAMGALTNKFLINICDGRVEMHDLLYTFSRELDPRASSQGGSKQRRLYRHQDIIKLGAINVLQNKMRAADVRGIFLDLSEVKGETILNRDHFINMDNLRYLKFYNSHCPQECKTDNKINLPDGLNLPLKEIRCLHWLKFPLEELPNDFNPINLVDLKLPYSEIEQLWDGDKDTPVLRWVDLNYSRKLSSLSGLSTAQNLQALNLEGCTSLESLRGVDSESLKILTLSGCSNFKEFPLIPENLEALYLDGTAIRELPDNMKNLQRLILLNMKNCIRLKNIPTCVGELRALQKLVLSGCRKLKDFPEFKESSIKILLLDGTSIKMMPQLPSVQYLCLSRNDQISYLPEGINQLSRLTRLDLKYCTSLTSIPELPPNLQYLDADGCSSLKTVAKPLARIMPTVQNHCIFNFTNCGNLEQAAMEEMASYARRKCQLLSDTRKHYNRGLSSESLFSTCFPGSEVPSWFGHEGIGSLLKLRLPPHWHEKSLSGIALCVVVSFPGGEDQISGLSVACTFTITDKEKSWIPFTCPVGSWIREGETIQCNHIFIAYISCPHTIRCLEDENSSNCNFTEASVEFTVTGGTSEIGKVLRCGLSLVYEKDKNKHSSLEAAYDMPVEVSRQEPQDMMLDDQIITRSEKQQKKKK